MKGHTSSRVQLSSLPACLQTLCRSVTEKKASDPMPLNSSLGRWPEMGHSDLNSTLLFCVVILHPLRKYSDLFRKLRSFIFTLHGTLTDNRGKNLHKKLNSVYLWTNLRDSFFTTVYIPPVFLGYFIFKGGI